MCTFPVGTETVTKCLTLRKAQRFQIYLIKSAKMILTSLLIIPRYSRSNSCTCIIIYLAPSPLPTPLGSLLAGYILLRYNLALRHKGKPFSILCLTRKPIIDQLLRCSANMSWFVDALVKHNKNKQQSKSFMFGLCRQV